VPIFPSTCCLLTLYRVVAIRIYIYTLCVFRSMLVCDTSYLTSISIQFVEKFDSILYVSLCVTDPEYIYIGTSAHNNANRYLPKRRSAAQRRNILEK